MTALHPAALPPLSLNRTERRPTQDTCPWCADPIPTHHTVRIEDRIGRRYCPRCAAATDPGAAAVAHLIEDTWQRLIGLADGTLHHSTAAPVLRSIADDVEAIGRCDLDVETTIDATGDALVITHAVVPRDLADQAAGDEDR